MSEENNSDAPAFYRQKRGLIQVWGKEAVQFLNGLITNDVAKLESFTFMRAAFPNAQGRLLAAVRVIRFDDRFFFETEAATHEKVFQNLFKFTFAGDFFVEDLSKAYEYFSIFAEAIPNFNYLIPQGNQIVWAKFGDDEGFLLKAIRGVGFDAFVPKKSAESFVDYLKQINVSELSDEQYEVARIENGIPLYAVDMDETTIVPELGIDEQISYNKGCYIGQEIIARIYFRGHVAKQLRGLICEDSNVKPNDELKSPDGKNAGKITSVTFSAKLGKTIALAFVRYDYLADETELKIGEVSAKVKNLPFTKNLR